MHACFVCARKAIATFMFGSAERLVCCGKQRVCITFVRRRVLANAEARARRAEFVLCEKRLAYDPCENATCSSSSASMIRSIALLARAISQLPSGYSAAICTAI